MPTHNRFFASPGRTLLGSIILTIIVGTFLLALPIAQKTPHHWLDLFFTATSATCVTGLLTVPLQSFTTFGHIIILILMQVGGLGIMTLTFFFMSLVIKMGIGTQLMAGRLLEIASWKDSKRILGFIISLTFCAELLGTIIFFFLLKSPEASLLHTLFLALFHSVSAFCSAGLTLFPHGMLSFITNIPFLLVTTLIMILGELGFITWYELIAYVKALVLHKRRPHLSLHTKIVLSITTGIVVISGLLLWLLEHTHSFSSLSPLTTLINVLFDTISYRSTGFTTLPLATMQLATFFLIMIISFIGSSPGSTGSGIKTTTFAISLASVRAIVFGRNFVEIKGRTIPNDQVLKALAVLFLSLAWVATTTFCLLITEQGWRFVDIMFEAFSAFTNLGLSVGLTPHLTYLGKIIVSLSMIIGRIGSLTLILALKTRQEKTEFHYPEERVMIG